MLEKILPLNELLTQYLNGAPSMAFDGDIKLFSSRDLFSIEFPDPQKVLQKTHLSKNWINKSLGENNNYDPIVSSKLRLIVHVNEDKISYIRAMADVKSVYNITSDDNGELRPSLWVYRLSNEEFIDFINNYPNLMDWYVWNIFEIREPGEK